VTTRAPSSRSSSSGPTHLVVATLGRAVGLRGEIEIRVVSDDPGRFEAGSIVLLDPDLRPLTVVAVRARGDRHVAAFSEVGDRTAAEALRGRDLVVPVEAARHLGPREYWDHELAGCLVVTEDGREVGEVNEVLHSAANDILAVGDHLIPLVEAIVRTVDLDAKRIVIHDMPGLLD
jgi:16S rRNA processing protein RimM